MTAMREKEGSSRTEQIRTIPKGNCKRTKRAIAGKMTSGVRGFEEIKAAVVNEANATSTGSRIDEISLAGLPSTYVGCPSTKKRSAPKTL
jgi:hypothetical protein